MPSSRSNVAMSSWRALPQDSPQTVQYATSLPLLPALREGVLVQLALERDEEHEVLIRDGNAGDLRIDEAREDVVEQPVLGGGESHALTPQLTQMLASSPSARVIVPTRCSWSSASGKSCQGGRYDGG